MFGTFSSIFIIFWRAALFLPCEEQNPSLADLAAAVQTEFDELTTEASTDVSERRCAALLYYSITDQSVRAFRIDSSRGDRIIEAGQIAIDITQSRWDIATFSPQSQECAYFAALSLLKRNEVSHVASLLEKTDILKGSQRAEILLQLAYVSLSIGQEKTASQGIRSLRAFLEKDAVYGADYDGHTCVLAMVMSASLGDELSCRWFCDRLTINAANADILADFYNVVLNSSVLDHSAFCTLAHVIKDLPSGKLREQFCTFMLFHDRNFSANDEADRLIWLEPGPTVECASICRRLFLAQPLSQNEESFLIADPARLRTVVNWLTEQLATSGNNNFPAESVRILRNTVQNCTNDGSAPFWYMTSRLAVIGAASDPEASRKCLREWLETLKAGAETDVVTSAATHLMRVAISLSDVESLRQILEAWRTTRAKMDHVERQLCDAETLRILQSLPDILAVAEIPPEIRSAFPFATGMIRPKDFQAARATFRTSHERFWFTAGYLTSRLKEERLISHLVIECCTATE